MANKEKYLIFGNGFIAEHYTKFLLSKGNAVRILFHSNRNPELSSSIQIKMGRNILSIQKSLKDYNPTYIILTQGLSFIPDNEKEIRRSIESNVLSPLMALEAAYHLHLKGQLKSLKKILTFGSAAEYGDSKIKKWSENNHETYPTSIYGLQKHWLFETTRFYSNSGLPCVHLRHFNAIGAGQNQRFVLSAFSKQVAKIEKKKQKPQIIVGDISQKRDFIDIRDAVLAYELILSKAKPGAVVNICTGKAWTIKNVINRLKILSSVPFSIKIDKKLFANKRTRNKTLTGNSVWLSKHGWKPRYSLQESILWTLDYWRNQKTYE